MTQVTRSAVRLAALMREGNVPFRRAVFTDYQVEMVVHWNWDCYLAMDTDGGLHFTVGRVDSMGYSIDQIGNYQDNHSDLIATLRDLIHQYIGVRL